MRLRPLQLTWCFALFMTLGLISHGYWLEFYQGIMPCPLCSLQRIAIMLLSILFLLGTLISSQMRKIHLLITVFSSATASVGIWLAGRQVWLQWFPSNKKETCGVSLQYLLKVLPMDKALLKALDGSAECAIVTWSFLHMSLAEWSCLFFIFFLFLSLMQGRRACQKK